MLRFVEKAVNKIRSGVNHTSADLTNNATVLYFDGSKESTVYTYRSHVFDDMRIADERYVEVLGFDTSIDNPMTGSFVNTAESNLAAVSYNGVPFGTLPYNLSFLKSIAAKGYTVRIKVKMAGYYDAVNGIPNLMAETADPRIIRLWVSSHEDDPSFPQFDELTALGEIGDIEEKLKCLKISERAGIKITDMNKVAFLYPNDKTWLAGKMPRSSFNIKPKFEVLEVPAGSSAKPHILIMDGSTPLFEASAHHKAYSTIVENLEKPCEGRVVFNYYGEDDSDQLRIVIRFD